MTIFLSQIRMQHCRRRATDGVKFWISYKQLAFLNSFSLLQAIQNKRPWCWDAAYVTSGYSTLQFKFQSCDVIDYFNDVYKVKISFVKVACA